MWTEVISPEYRTYYRVPTYTALVALHILITRCYEGKNFNNLAVSNANTNISTVICNRFIGTPRTRLQTFYFMSLSYVRLCS